MSFLFCTNYMYGGKSIEVFILCIKDVRLLHQHNFDEISFGLGKGKDEDDDG